jgi:biotin transporter BioY
VSYGTDDLIDDVDRQLRRQLRRRLQILMTAILVVPALLLHLVDGVPWLATLIGLAAVEVVAVGAPPLLLSQALDRTKPPPG